jgi:hypothetical protein
MLCVFSASSAFAAFTVSVGGKSVTSGTSDTGTGYTLAIAGDESAATLTLASSYTGETITSDIPLTITLNGNVTLTAPISAGALTITSPNSYKLTVTPTTGAAITGTTTVDITGNVSIEATAGTSDVAGITGATVTINTNGTVKAIGNGTGKGINGSTALKIQKGIIDVGATGTSNAEITSEAGETVTIAAGSTVTLTTSTSAAGVLNVLGIVGGAITLGDDSEVNISTAGSVAAAATALKGGKITINSSATISCANLVVEAKDALVISSALTAKTLTGKTIDINGATVSTNSGAAAAAITTTEGALTIRGSAEVTAVSSSTAGVSTVGAINLGIGAKLTSANGIKAANHGSNTQIIGNITIDGTLESMGSTGDIEAEGALIINSDVTAKSLEGLTIDINNAEVTAGGTANTFTTPAISTTGGALTITGSKAEVTALTYAGTVGVSTTGAINLGIGATLTSANGIKAEDDDPLIGNITIDGTLSPMGIVGTIEAEGALVINSAVTARSLKGLTIDINNVEVTAGDDNGTTGLEAAAISSTGGLIRITGSKANVTAKTKEAANIAVSGAGGIELGAGAKLSAAHGIKATDVTAPEIIGHITIDGTLTLSATGGISTVKGDITLNSNITPAGGISTTTGGDIYINGSVTGGAISAGNGGSITVAQGKTLTATSVAATAAAGVGGNITVNGTIALGTTGTGITAGGALLVANTGGITGTAGTITIGAASMEINSSKLPATANLTATGDILLTASVAALKDITATGGNITLERGVTSAGAITATKTTTGGSITIGGATTTTGNINAQSSLVLDGIVTAGGAVSGDTITINKALTVGGTGTLEATGALYVNAATEVAGAIEAGDDIIINAALSGTTLTTTETEGGSITINADVTLSGELTSDANLTVAEGKKLAGATDITAGDALILNGAAPDATALEGKSVEIGAKATLGATTSPEITATEGDILIAAKDLKVGAIDATDGDVTITGSLAEFATIDATGDINISGAIKAEATADGTIASSGGDITISADVTAASLAATSGDVLITDGAKVTLTATTAPAIAANEVTIEESASVETALASGNDITAGKLSILTNGKLSRKDGSDLVLDGVGDTYFDGTAQIALANAPKITGSEVSYSDGTAHVTITGTNLDPSSYVFVGNVQVNPGAVRWSEETDAENNPYQILTFALVEGWSNAIAVSTSKGVGRAVAEFPTYPEATVERNTLDVFRPASSAVSKWNALIDTLHRTTVYTDDTLTLTFTFVAPVTKNTKMTFSGDIVEYLNWDNDILSAGSNEATVTFTFKKSLATRSLEVSTGADLLAGDQLPAYSVISASLEGDENNELGHPSTSTYAFYDPVSYSPSFAAPSIGYVGKIDLGLKGGSPSLQCRIIGYNEDKWFDAYPTPEFSPAAIAAFYAVGGSIELKDVNTGDEVIVISGPNSSGSNPGTPPVSTHGVTLLPHVNLVTGAGLHWSSAQAFTFKVTRPSGIENELVLDIVGLVDGKETVSGATWTPVTLESDLLQVLVTNITTDIRIGISFRESTGIVTPVSSSIVSTFGGISITSPLSGIARIYSLRGTLVKEFSYAEGSTSAVLPAGLYIVTLSDGSITKVLVR